MKLREVRIENYRNLKNVRIPIDDTTVLIGENNSGKTAFLDAMRAAVPKTTSGRVNPFNEYDYHMTKKGDSHETSDGIVIEMWFREDNPDEWSDSLMQALNEIVQTDPITDLDYVGVRLSSAYDSDAKDMDHKWEFLALDGQPLTGKSQSSTMLSRFFSYVKLFYLSALRDSSEEFSPRSQYWGRIIRDLKISSEQKEQLTEELAKLNDSLLRADSRIANVSDSLNKVNTIVSAGSGKSTSIQALPMKPWELLSKSEAVMKPHGSEIEFPLSRYGQGTQSLSVLFLFEAYVQMLLKPTFQSETEAILALEEPEAHLHPQAARSLAASMHEVGNQRIVSSHCPYFIQEIPLNQIRLFRKNGAEAGVLFLKRKYTLCLPESKESSAFCNGSGGKFIYEKHSGILSFAGKMTRKEQDSLNALHSADTDAQKRIDDAYQESQYYLSDQDVRDLETYAKRMRGEVFFARAWLLCEGQSEYLALRCFANLLGKPLDHYGVTVIDFQNNGSPRAFISLARTFGIPWLMFCDNDGQCSNFVSQARDCGLSDSEIDELVRPLPTDGMDWERYPFANGFKEQIVEMLTDWAKSAQPSNLCPIIAKARSSKTQEDFRVVLDTAAGYRIDILKKGKTTKRIDDSDEDFEALLEDICVREMQRDKTRTASALVDRLISSGAKADCVPAFIATLIHDVIGKAGVA